MKRILIFSLLATLLNSEELTLLNKNRQEIIKLQKEQIISNYKSNKNNWISPINLNSNINRSESTSNSDTTTKRISLNFSQSVFKSGGIKLQIEYADDKKSYDLLSLENENLILLEAIYETLLKIKKIKLQIKQSEFKLQNREIEIVLKKIEYESGKLDITDLNNAILAKNSQFREIISLKNSLKNANLELSKFTDFKYDEIEIKGFSEISQDEFLNKNIELKLQKAKTAMLKRDYLKAKTEYLPKVNLNGEYGYSDSDTNKIQNDGDYNSIGVSLSIPLDYNKNSNLATSKLIYLKEKLQIDELKREILNSYEQSMTQIDTYRLHNETIRENIKLYSELIDVTITKTVAGYSSEYDLDILKNTLAIDEYELKINNINIELELVKLYFKLQG